MKHIRFLFVALAAAAFMLPFAAQAETPGWYVGAGAMPVFQTDADSKVAGVTDIIKYHTGWGVSGSGGYMWGNGIRTEAEIAYRHSGVDEVTGTGAGPVNDGTMHNVSFMGNVLYDIETGTRFTPYVGAGIGLGVPTADEIRTVNGQQLDSTRPTFAYQAIGGVEAAMDDNWSVTADYRYYRTLDEKYHTNSDDHATTDNASHNILVGLRYKFVKPAAVTPMAPAAPMPKAAPVAQPAVPAVPQSYMVFFDFDKYELTPEAKQIIASAAQDFKGGKYVRIVVTGHTDTVGTVKYNQKLSERRAAAVKKEFAKLGVPTAEIQAVGVGKTGLLVPTADGVREAQNRRAEIVFDQK